MDDEFPRHPHSTEEYTLWMANVWRMNMERNNNETVAFMFSENKYPLIVPIAEAKSEILEPITIDVLISIANKLSERLTELDSDLQSEPSNKVCYTCGGDCEQC